MKSLSYITSTDYDNYFTCFDSAVTNPAQGNNVTYDNSWTGRNLGGIDIISYIYYFD